MSKRDSLAEKIGCLDLSRVHQNLKRKENWSHRKIEANISEYRKFLYIMGKHGGTLVPWTEDMDTVWHYHMLDSRLYREHCEELFGRFIDHDPLLSDSRVEHREAFERTKRLYFQEFGSKRSWWRRMTDRHKRNEQEEWMESDWDISFPENNSASSDASSPDTKSHSIFDWFGSGSEGNSDSSCGSGCGSSCGGGCGGD